jgi:hypothetical protein
MAMPTVTQAELNELGSSWVVPTGPCRRATASGSTRIRTSLIAPVPQLSAPHRLLTGVAEHETGLRTEVACLIDFGVETETVLSALGGPDEVRRAAQGEASRPMTRSGAA